MYDVVATADPRVERASTVSTSMSGIVGCPIPVPVGIGRPGFGYPAPCLLQTWLPGRIASARAAENGDAVARDVVLLIAPLRKADTRGRSFSGRGRAGLL